MVSLKDSFLSGSQRVTARVLYYRPLRENQPPLKIDTGLIGHAPKEVHHTNILQDYVHQFDDKADFEHEGLKQVFADLVLANKGVVKLYNRHDRLSVMLDDQGQTGPKVQPLLIPRPAEETNPGMQDEVKAFKTLIPFPSVRSFLQHWQENLKGPLYLVQLAAQPIHQTDLRVAAMDRTLN